MSTFSALRCGVRVDRSIKPVPRPRPGATRRRVAGWREDSPLAPPDGASKKKSKRDKRKGAATPRVEGGGKGEVDGAELNTIDLGQGKSAALYVPTDVAEVEGAVSAEGVKQLLARYEDSPTVPATWCGPRRSPSADYRALPVPRQDKSVIEIGSGLGLCGCVAAAAGASRVVMTDVDGDMPRSPSKSAGQTAAATSSRP